MQDHPQQFQRGIFTITTDRQQIDLPAALSLLHCTSWGGGMTLAVLEQAAENSVCFGLYEGQMLIGFARAITDLATFAYLTDVVIDETKRGQGLGRWLIECVLAHPDLRNLRRISLLTSDAQALYLPFGFAFGTDSKTYMELRNHPQNKP
jgi:N-acetylglutamate synthase-like GNAT family acetyltransferase